MKTKARIGWMILTLALLGGQVGGEVRAGE